MKKLVVIGSINVDLFIKTDKIPDVGETLLGNDFSILQGGKGANQAVAASRLGADVSFIGAVGNDENGTLALSNLNNEQIDTSCVTVFDNVPTGVANVISCNGDNSIIVVPGANSLVDDRYVEMMKDKIISSDIILLQNEIPVSGIKKAIEIANEHSKTVIYNPAPFIKEANQLSTLVTYCTPNEIEASEMKINDNLIVTLGEKGVKFKDEIYPANKIDVVDTTGAGDTFNGALCASLAAGNKIGTAIQFGINASGIAIQSVGAQTGMPYRKDL